MQELLRNKNIEIKTKYITQSQSEHNPSDPIKLSIATAERLHMCLDHVGQLMASRPSLVTQSGRLRCRQQQISLGEDTKVCLQ